MMDYWVYTQKKTMIYNNCNSDDIQLLAFYCILSPKKNLTKLYSNCTELYCNCTELYSNCTELYSNCTKKTIIVLRIKKKRR